MMNNKYTQYCYGFSFMLMLFFLGACTKIDDTYHDFWKEGQRIYPASPDSLEAFSGRNRIQLQWLNIGDPTLKKAVVYWNNHSDSLVVPIEKKETDGNDTMTVLIDPLAEGAYSFDVFTYDKYGNRSVVSNAIGKVYGDTYAGSLLTRLIENNSFLDDTLHIQWGDPADATAVGTEIVYVDKNGEERHRILASNADTTVVPDYDNNASKYFEYRTLFLPDSTAIDTFYTAYDSVRVLGPRTDLSRTGWEATASSYDERHGDNRKPFSALDNNTSSAWINQISTQTFFPHTLIVDMEEVKNDIFGVSLYLKKRSETPNSMNIYISADSNNWNSLGLYAVQNATGWQYFDFAEPQQFRYLKLVFEGSYGSDNVVIYEAGVYTR